MTRTMTQSSARAVAPAAIVLAVVALAFVLLANGSRYTIHARFSNAGRLVTGGEVQIAGRKVGSIAAIGVTPDGLADVALSIDDHSVVPLHVGTRAAIRAVGQATIANNFVELSPGPQSAPVLRDGAVLSTSQTEGIVDIDALLDSFGPVQRANLDGLIANSASVYAGSGARYFNAMLGKLDPALAELNGVAGELALDRTGLAQLIQTANEATTAIASRSTDLSAAVRNTAVALGAVASERAALADTLARAPAVLSQARGTLASTGVALTALRPALRDVLPVAAPLHRVLAGVSSVLPQAGPVVAQLLGQLPALNDSLTGLVPLERPAVRALRSTGQSMKDLSHIFRALRFYGSDLVIGVLAGLGGIASGEYDSYGHYGKSNFVQSPQTLAAGPLASLLSAHPLVPGLLDTRTKLARRCPGGNVPPAPDGSSPWVLGKSLCTPADDIPASVNTP